MQKQETFKVPYYGVSITVTPIVNDLDMLYQVKLPTRDVLIQMSPEPEAMLISLWEEIPGGQTQLAQEIGTLIMEKDLLEGLE